MIFLLQILLFVSFFIVYAFILHQYVLYYHLIFSIIEKKVWFLFGRLKSLMYLSTRKQRWRDSSAGNSVGFIIRTSWVRVPPPLQKSLVSIILARLFFVYYNFYKIVSYILVNIYYKGSSDKHRGLFYR